MALNTDISIIVKIAIHTGASIPGVCTELTGITGGTVRGRIGTRYAGIATGEAGRIGGRV